VRDGELQDRDLAQGKILPVSCRYGSDDTKIRCPRYVRFPPDSDRKTEIAVGFKRARNGLSIAIFFTDDSRTWTV